MWNINLLSLIGLEIVPWTKTLIWSTDGRTYRHTHNPNALCPRRTEAVEALKSIVLPFSPNKSIGDQIWPCRKIGQCQPRIIVWTNLVVLSTECYIPTFKVISLLVPKKKIFSGFYHIWTWGPYWSCDLDHLNKFSFPYPMKSSVWNWIWVTLDQGHWMTLTFNIHIGSCTQLVNCIYQLWYHSLQ